MNGKRLSPSIVRKPKVSSDFDNRRLRFWSEGLEKGVKALPEAGQAR